MEIHLNGKDKFFEDAKELVNWTAEHEEGLCLNEAEAKLLLDYAEGSGYRVGSNQFGMLQIESDDSEVSSVPCAFNYFVRLMLHCNEEFYDFDEIPIGIVNDKEILINILDRCESTTGYSLKGITVKDMIKVLSTLPENYEVYCCGTHCYLYLFPDSESITLDCESYLA